MELLRTDRVGGGALALVEVATIRGRKDAVEEATEGGGGSGACGVGRGGGSFVLRWVRLCEAPVGELMEKYEDATGYPGGVEKPSPVVDETGESLLSREAELEREGEGRTLAV